MQDGDTLFIYLKPDLLEKFKKDYVEKPISTPLDIIYEDKNIVVVNKPRGLLIHSDGKDSKFTLANMLTSYLIQKVNSTRTILMALFLDLVIDWIEIPLALSSVPRIFLQCRNYWLCSEIELK